MNFISGAAGMLLQQGNTAPAADTLNNATVNETERIRNGNLNQLNNGAPINTETANGFIDHPSKDKPDSGLVPYSSQNGGQYSTLYNKMPVTGLAVGSGAGFDAGSGAGLGAVLSAGLGICSTVQSGVNNGIVASVQNTEISLEAIRKDLKEGWTVHTARDGRLYYCNHTTRTAGWLPPVECWTPDILGSHDLPYGWEQATDHRNRPYYINHVNKTTTYEAPGNGEEVEIPSPRSVTLIRDPELGFGFVAGSEKPVLVRSVTEGGPSVDKLEPGDQILSVNGEDVEQAPRDHVIGLVRACTTRVNLVVCQPLAAACAAGRRSAILSRARKARLKARPGRVRFAESVCVNGSPLFPPSAFSLGDLCLPPMANVLKVFLENGQTKSFKYDATTTVQDVVTSLKDKLCITAGEHFSLVVEHVKSLRRNKLTLLDPKESLARIAARPGAHKLRCLFRVSFVPTSAAELAQKDLNAMDYLYMQCCNDVAQDRFAPELQPEVALRLAALHMHQHALAHNMSPGKLTVKAVEREFGLERFVPCGLLETMKRKELRRLIAHFLKLNLQMTGNQQKYLSQLQAKLHYLDIISGLPSYGAKCFSSNQPERVLLVSPRFGLSQIAGIRNSIPTLICNLEDLVALRLMREDELSFSITIYLVRDKVLSFSMEDRDGAELALVLNGYYRLATGRELEIDQEREPIPDDIAPPYLSQHNVVPAKWSYINCENPNVLSRSHYITFAMPPPYHSIPKINVNGLDTNMNSAIANKNHTNSLNNSPLIGYENSKQGNKFTNSVYDNYNENDEFGKTDNMWFDDNLGFDFQSILSMEILEAVSDSKLVEARNEEIIKRVSEMQKLVENSEQYLTEQGEIVYKNSTNGSEKSWQESSVDRLESDTESTHSRMSSLDDTPGTLKHSDSLILLTETINQGLNGINTGLNSIIPPTTKANTDDSLKNRQTQGLSAILNSCGLTDALAALNTDLSQSESDNDSLYTPTNSPIHRQQNKQSNLQSKIIRTSFGLHSPDNPNVQTGREQNLREYLHQLRENANNSQSSGIASEMTGDISSENRDSSLFNGEMINMIEMDPDLIDLTLLPPPQTPDELDGNPQIPQVIPTVPSSFADKNDVENGAKNKNNQEKDKDEFEEFLATVTIDPPTSKITPAVELTPEEIMSYIIPPPPVTSTSSGGIVEMAENIYSNQSQINQHETRVTNLMKNYRNQAMTSGPKVSEIRDMFNAKSLSQARNSLTLTDKTLDKSKLYEVSYLNIEANNKNANAKSSVPNGQVIEYPTVDRKGVFSCCTKDCKQKTEDSDTVDDTDCDISPPPRSTKVEPPERPPKSLEVVNSARPRSNSFSYSFNGVPLTEPLENRFNTLNSRKLNYNMVCSQNRISNGFDDGTPPLIPPRGGSIPSTIPPHILMPPKKPPLPPVPSLEVLRMKAALKNNSPVQKNGTEPRVASIGSPHFQRNPNLYRDIELEHQTNFANSEPPTVAMRSRTHSQPECTSQNLSLPISANDKNNSGHIRSHSETRNTILKNKEMSTIFSLCSPQMNRKMTGNDVPSGFNTLQFGSNSRNHTNYKSLTLRPDQGNSSQVRTNHVRFKDNLDDTKMNTLPSPSMRYKISGDCPPGANGHVINVETLLQKTEVAVDGLLSRLHQVAQNCSHQHAHGGGEDIDERKFQIARDELTNEAVALVTESRSLVSALAAGAARGVAGPLAECLNSLRRLADLSQALGRHTSAPLQTRNLVLRVHDVTAAFKELSGADMAKVVREHNQKMAEQQSDGTSSLEGQLALRAECLANVLATLLRSLRVFSP